MRHDEAILEDGRYLPGITEHHFTITWRSAKLKLRFLGSCKINCIVTPHLSLNFRGYSDKYFGASYSYLLLNQALSATFSIKHQHL